jgi:hypothetical protein
MPLVSKGLYKIVRPNKAHGSVQKTAYSHYYRSREERARIHDYRSRHLIPLAKGKPSSTSPPATRTKTRLGFHFFKPTRRKFGLYSRALEASPTPRTGRKLSNDQQGPQKGRRFDLDLTFSSAVDIPHCQAPKSRTFIVHHPYSWARPSECIQPLRNLTDSKQFSVVGSRET